MIKKPLLVLKFIKNFADFKLFFITTPAINKLEFAKIWIYNNFNLYQLKFFFSGFYLKNN